MKKLLVVVDYQNDFVDGALGFAGAETLEPGICAAVESTLAGGGFVLFTRDTHPEQYLATREGRFLPVPHCIEGSEGHHLYGALRQYELQLPAGVQLLNKEGFGSPDIGTQAVALCGGEPDEVTLCGLVTDICVVCNAIILHSQLPHAAIRVQAELCGSANAEGTAHALALLRGLGIEITD